MDLQVQIAGLPQLFLLVLFDFIHKAKHDSHLLVNYCLNWFKPRHVSVVCHTLDMCLKLSHLFLNFCYHTIVAICSDIRLLYHVTNKRFQVSEAHQIISLLASFVKSQGTLVAQFVHLLLIQVHISVFSTLNKA